MAKKKNFWEQVADVASRSFDQVNPFDNGKTFTNRVGTVAPAPRPTPAPLPVLSAPSRVPAVSVISAPVASAPVAPKPNMLEDMTAALSQNISGIPAAVKYGWKDAKAERDQLEAAQRQSAGLIAQAGKKIQDPTTSPEERLRWQKLARRENARGREAFYQATTKNDDVLAVTDPIKNAAAVAETAFDVMTLPVGFAAQPIKIAGKQALKMAGKEAAELISKQGLKGEAKQAVIDQTRKLAGKNAFWAKAKEMNKQGNQMGMALAPAGALHPVTTDGSEADWKDMAVGGAAAFGVGKVLPPLAYGASKAFPSVARGTVAGAGEAVRKAEQSIPRVKEIDTFDAPMMEKAVKNAATPEERQAAVDALARLGEERRAITEGGYLAGKKSAESFTLLDGQGKSFKIAGGKAVEVSDEGLSLKPGFLDTRTRVTTIGDIIDHPLMFKDYEALKNMKLVLKSEAPERSGGKLYITGGSYDPHDKVMFLNTNPRLSAKDRFDTLIHEMSHARDDIEGLPMGGSSGAKYLDKEVAARMAANPKLDEGTARFQAYQDLVGENKARTETNRSGMTDEERALRPWTADYDRDPSQGVLRKDKPEDRAWVTGKPPAEALDYSDTVVRAKKGAPEKSSIKTYTHPAIKTGAEIPGTDLKVPGGRRSTIGRTEYSPEEMLPIREAVKKAADAGKAARIKAELAAESKISIKDKVKDFINNNFLDDARFWQELDNSLTKRNWWGQRQFKNASERIDPMVQAFRNSKAMQLEKQRDLGISDFAAKLSRETTYDAYRIYRTFRTNFERAIKNQKRGEDFDSAYARFTGGRDFSEDEYLFNQLDQDPKFGNLFSEENAIANRILRERGDNPNFTMTRQEAEDIIAEYPNFTPQNRVLSEDLIVMRKSGKVGSMQGANVKKLQGGSKTKQLEDPLVNLRDYSDELVSKSTGNDIMNLLLKQFPEKFRSVVNVDQIKAKEAAVIRMSELGTAGRALTAALRRNSKVARALMKELNDLNKEGVKKSVRQPAKVKIARPTPTVTVKTIHRQYIKNAPKDMDALKQSYEIKAKLNKVYAKGPQGIADMALDIHHGGWTKLAQLTGVSKATARSVAEQVLKAPTIRGAEISVKAGQIGRTPTVHQLVEELINKRPADVERIIKKIANRDEKLTDILDDIGQLAKRADDIKAERAGIMTSGDLDAFEKAAGKNTRRRVIDNREEIWEVTDPRLAHALDNMSGHQLSAAAEKLGVPVRIVKFFTTGPGNVIAFVPIAITRDVLASILYAKAPLRAAFDPRSYVDAIMVAAKQGELYKDFQRRGISGTMAEADRPTRKASSDAMRNQGIRRIKVWVKEPRQLFRDFEEIDMAAERFTRARLASARYRQQLAHYKQDDSITPDQARNLALWDAAEEYRESALNFGRAGAVTRELNSVTAYLNPAVVAGNKMRKSFADSPLGFTARASVATSLVWGAWAYSNGNEKRKAVYDRIDPEEKLSNILIVTDDADFDEEKGRTKGGIVKIPLPYEFRAFSTAIMQAMDKADDEQYGNLVLSGMAMLSGLDTRNFSSMAGQFMPTTARAPLENITNWSFWRDANLIPDYLIEDSNGDKTKQFTKASSGTSRAISRATGGAISPIEADNLVSGAFGGATKDILAASDTVLNKFGVVPNEEKLASDPVTRLKTRYTQAYGKSDTALFFDELEVKRKTIKDVDDRKAFDMLHSKDPTPGFLDSAEKAGVYLNRPDVVRADRELDRDMQAKGQPGNPIFGLSEDQMRKVLLYRHSKMLNAGKQTYDKNGNPLFTSLGLDEAWYEKFRNDESAFYDKILGDKPEDPNARKTFSGATKPEASDELQALLDKYYTLPKGTGQRSDMLRAFPEILQYWEANDGFTNRERLAIGLKPLTDEGASGSGGYGGSGGGRKRTAVEQPESFAAPRKPTSGGSPSVRKVAVKKRTPKKITVRRKKRV
jgi:hypothetical protein